MTPILELTDLTKWFRTNWTFRTIKAIDGVSLSVEPGEVFGLIGHNGSGKTTTFKLLVGLLRPTRGTVWWNGERLLDGARSPAFGFAPEQPYFYDYLTVRETLDFYGQLYGVPSAERRRRIGALADELQLETKMDTAVRTLSKGTLQRLAVAQAIMHRPRLVILDEPMSGLDPAGRKHMRDRILRLKRDGATVLFSSHILTDAEALCDRVAIVAAGKLREIVNLDRRTTEPTAYRLSCLAASDRAAEVLSRLATPPTAKAPHWTLMCKNRDAVRVVLGELLNAGVHVEAIVPEYPSLEQRFLANEADAASAE